MKSFNVALIGCGAISNNHLNPIIADPRCKLVALCDKSLEKALAKKEKYDSYCNVYTDYKEMIEREKLDAIHICTPHFLHAPMAIYALERNINVFLEKPMCINRDEIQKLLEAEKKSNAKICVCFQNRFNPTTIAAQKLIESDGGPISAYGSVFWERTAPYYQNSDWRGEPETEGGGVMINQAIHTIDLLGYFLGKPEKVVATTANHHLKGIINVEDTCEGVIKYDTGLQANFYATTAYLGYSATRVFVLTKNYKIEIASPNLYVNGEKFDVENEDTGFVGKEVYGNGHKYIIGKFYDAVENDTEVPVTLESAQYAIRVLLGAYESFDNEIKI